MPTTGDTHRRKHGVYYTPERFARETVDRTLAPMEKQPSRILDPCCGDGALLAAAWEHGVARGWCPHEMLRALAGADIDEAAVETARARLIALAVSQGVPAPEAQQVTRRNLTCEDGFDLVMDGCDAIVTNPPFGNAIGADTARSQGERERHRSAVPEVARGAYDRSFAFAARAVQRLRPGGRYGMILPRSVLSVHSATGLRAYIDARAAPDTILTPVSSRLFAGADVFVTTIIGASGPMPSEVTVSDCEKGDRNVRRSGREAAWWELVDPDNGLLHHVLDTPIPLCTLGELLSLRAGATTATAYELAPLVEEGGAGAKLVTTGLIDRYECTWGTRKCRYLKRTFQRPAWPATPTGSVQRAQQAQSRPKILIAGLSKVLEAVADPQGQLAGVVSTWWAVPHPGQAERLWIWEALLNAPILSVIYAIRYRGKELSGGNITVGKRELASLPVPADLGTLSALEGAPLTTLDQVFAGSPLDDSHRQRLASTAVRAVQRRGWSAPETSQDLLAASAIACLYGASRETFETVQRWFDSRQPVGSR